MTNFAHGREAEAAAAQYLVRNGFKILAQNWRTRLCEIDIIAQKKKQIYFVEVKYRKNDRQGTGVEYITTKKLSQMQFAAEFWVSDTGWRGEYQLAVLEVSGPSYEITNFLTEF